MDQEDVSKQRAPDPISHIRLSYQSELAGNEWI